MVTPGEMIFFVISFLWLAGLSYFLYTLQARSSRILKDAKKDSVLDLLNGVVKSEEANKRAIDELSHQYAKLNKDGLSHIQKIGLVRFNPFKDTGGDQSFILALVDAENTGIVISSLHTRTGTRWYAKAVISGKGVEYDLSDEEEKALKGAKTLSVKGK